MKRLTFTIALLAIWASAFAQYQYPVTLPDASPGTKLTQEIGLSTVTVSYNSPSKRDREIWGKVVPYDQIWRAGANENTVFTLSHDAEVAGKKLNAGTYGFHIIPRESEDWTVIFSKVSTAWGSYFYDEGKDALRIDVPSKEGEFDRESLSFDFRNRSSESADLVMHWGKKMIAVPVKFDTKNVTVNSLRKEMQSRPYWGWTGLCNAARYCLDNDVNLEEGEAWADRSVQLDRNFTNLQVKSNYLKKSDKTKEAEELMAEAVEMASERDLINYSFSLMGEEKGKQAIKVLSDNLERFDDSWILHFYLGRHNATLENKKAAKKHYETALKGAPEDQKKVIEGVLEKLG